MSQQRPSSTQYGAIAPAGNSGNMAQYKTLRQQAYQASRAIEEQEKQYREQRDRMLRQMDAQFRNKIAPLEDQYYQAQDQIQLSEQTATRKLRRMEDQVIADPNISPEEKVTRITALRKSFTDTFHPDDEYEQHITEHSMEKLISALFGQGMMGMMGMGSGPMSFGGAGPKMISYSIGGPSGRMMGSMNQKPGTTPVIEEIED